MAQPNDQSDCTFMPGEEVSLSGLYEVCHYDEPEPRNKVVLIIKSVFPFCRTCGDKVRYKLCYAAPHISEDPEFLENDDYSPNYQADSSVPQEPLPSQLGVAHGYRFATEKLREPHIVP
jgi:hypothetical protein